jgi:AbrB family looped-hinge helix DNA binding protein
MPGKEPEMLTAKIGRRGQITIPKTVRQRLSIVEGQRVAFVIKGGEVTLQPLTTTIEDHRGIVPIKGPQDFEAVRRAVRRVRGAARGR